MKLKNSTKIKPHIEKSKIIKETIFTNTYISKNILYKLVFFWSIFITETLAIYEPMSYSLLINHNNVLILRDSMSANTSVDNKNTKCNHTQCIQIMIFPLNKKVSQMWIPSYVKIPVIKLSRIRTDRKNSYFSQQVYICTPSIKYYMTIQPNSKN